MKVSCDVSLDANKVKNTIKRVYQFGNMETGLPVETIL